MLLVCLGAFVADLGTLLAVLGMLLDPLSRSWGLATLGLLLGCSSDDLGRSWTALGALNMLSVLFC